MDRQSKFQTGFTTCGHASHPFGQGYDRMVDAVRAGRLNFCVLLGMPGGLSTATLRWLAPYAHAVLCEPDGRFFLRRGEPALTASDRASRKQEFYKYLADIFGQEYERNGGQPVTIIAKLMPHLWFNDDMMHELLALCPNPIGLARHPGLALPSWLEKRSELLLAGIEIGQDPLCAEDKDILREMIQTKDYSRFPKSFWNLHRHLYQGNVDQDTQWVGTGDNRTLREYTDFYRVFKAWVGQFNTDVPHVVDVELLQYGPQAMMDCVFRPRWGLERQPTPGLFINGYEDHPDVSNIVFGPQEKLDILGLRPPIKHPIEMGQIPYYLRNEYQRSVGLYIDTILQHGQNFPQWSVAARQSLGRVFQFNCLAQNGKPPVWNVPRYMRWGHWVGAVSGRQGSFGF